MKLFPLAIFSLLLLAAAVSIARADGGLSLEQAIDETAHASPAIRKSEAAMSEADWGRTEARSVFLPKLSISATHFFDSKYELLTIPFNGVPFTFPQIYASTTVSFDAALTLFDGFQNVNHYGAASLAREAAELEHSWLSFQVEQEIRLRFYQALAAQIRLTVAEQNERTLQDHLDKVKAVLESGSATRYDVLRVEVQFSEAGSEKLAAQDNLVIARERLTEAMGLKEDARLLAGELPLPAVGHVSGTAAAAPEERADLKALGLRADAAGKRGTEAAAFWVPKVSLLGEYQWYNNTNRSISDTGSFLSAYSLGLGLTWNIFDGGASLARAHEAAQQAIQADAAADAQRLKAPVDFDFWKRRYLYSTAIFRARKEDVVKSEESVRLASLGFKAGTRTTTEVLDAELDLFRARGGLIQSQLDAAEALINLELAMGKKVTS